MKIAREGIPFVLGFLSLAGASALAGITLSAFPGWLAFLLTTPLLFLGLFSVWFFRDPERAPAAGRGLVLSPADGRVVAVADDPAGPSLAIFLSVLDVHVNRSPIAGRVESVEYREGRFLAAFDPRAGEVNERNEILLSGPEGSVRVRQIAGAIARRIVCRVKPGDRLSAGQRLGMIRFGSRTDLRLPPGSALLVGQGERVKGGITIVGRMPVSAARDGDPVLGPEEARSEAATGGNQRDEAPPVPTSDVPAGVMGGAVSSSSCLQRAQSVEEVPGPGHPRERQMMPIDARRVGGEGG
jgi:phosphatidylserine decarboxylase